MHKELRTRVTYGVLALLAVVALRTLWSNTQDVETVGYSTFERYLAEGLIDEVTVSETTVVGLLRLSEPDGGFLRANDPAGDRWFSRDVAGIAKARGLSGPVAPYFIDADATPNPGGWPRGGLTVVRFANSHLIYALTWFGLAIVLAGFYVALLRRRLKKDTP